jgi:hypothetical protein
MKATSLIQAVSQIKGEKVSEDQAKEFASKNYLELHLFIIHNERCEQLKKEITRKRATNNYLKTFGNRINGLKN